MSEAQQVEPWAVAVDADGVPVVLEHINEYAVTVDPGPDLLVVTVGEQGPPGAPGSGLSEWQINEW